MAILTVGIKNKRLVPPRSHRAQRTDMSQSTQEDHATRFAHLLQPIRDLTENWNIDIARELEEYLNEVGHLCHS